MVLNKINYGKGSKLHIIRTVLENKQIRGQFVVFTDDYDCIYAGTTLELPYLENAKNISSIPHGFYRGSLHFSPKFENCISIHNVPKRGNILIHNGNYYTNTEGCILVGNGFKDLNLDAILDVVNSMHTLKMLNLAMKPLFEIFVLNAFKGSL